jgi:signal transduction histidine kinase
MNTTIVEANDVACIQQHTNAISLSQCEVIGPPPIARRSEVLGDRRMPALDDWRMSRASDMLLVEQMASGVAHDFNNRIQGVMSALSLLKARLQQGRTADCDLLVEAAQTSLLQAGHLTRQLLNFARPIEVARREIDLNDTVRSMLPIFKCLTGRRIEIELKLSTSAAVAFCDGHQLENALLNLIVNARDAMPDGGALRIETSQAILDVDMEDLERGRYARICVSDTGCGMTREVIGRAFEPFFTTKPSGKGTGLGLPMIGKFVHQSKGHVELQSTAGAGTAISIYLPSTSA